MPTLSLGRHQKDTLTIPITVGADLTGATILFTLADYNQETEGVEIHISPGETESRIEIRVHYDLTGALRTDRAHSIGVVILWPDDTRTTIIDSKLSLRPKVADVVVDV